MLGRGLFTGEATLIDPRDSFVSLARGLAAGDDSAVGAVFEKYAHRLVALARSRLDPRLAARVDPEDVVLSALRSFILQCREGEVSFHDPERLWKMLAVITLRKCYRQRERHFAARRDVRRDADAGKEDDSVSEGNDAVVPSREPTPEEAAQLTETVQEVMNRLDPLKRQIFEMSLQGHDIAYIARELNYYERGVTRARAEIRALLVEIAAA